MAQLRLTKKVAADLKADPLGSPRENLSMFDDWFVDTIRVQRQKVAIVTHAKSLLTFLLPYSMIGGVQCAPNCIALLLKKFIRDNRIEIEFSTIDQVFTMPHRFCKTVDRRILGPMNAFKRCVEIWIYRNNQPFNEIDWDDVAHSVNKIPVGTRSYDCPCELAVMLFSGLKIERK